MKLIESEFNGHTSVELVTESLRLVIATDFGPRIAFFGKPGDENLLLWAPGKHFRNKWELTGGHRVWVTRPLADECEETYLLDNEQCEVVRTGSGWVVTAPPHPVNNTRRGVSITLIEENKIEVDNFMINNGDMLYSGGVWGLTCTVPGKDTQYGIPLSNGSSWDFCKIVMFGRWDGHTGGFNDDQFTFKDDIMLISPKGRENKRMIMSEKGIFAMRDVARDILFAKKTEFIRTGRYPHECNLAAYVGPDNFMVEMESMGCESTVRPGESIHNKEMWVLESSEIALDAAKLSELF
jgi:hypothetical protein